MPRKVKGKAVAVVDPKERAVEVIGQLAAGKTFGEIGVEPGVLFAALDSDEKLEGEYEKAYRRGAEVLVHQAVDLARQMVAKPGSNQAQKAADSLIQLSKWIAERWAPARYSLRPTLMTRQMSVCIETTLDLGGPKSLDGVYELVAQPMEVEAPRSMQEMKEQVACLEMSKQLEQPESGGQPATGTLRDSERSGARSRHSTRGARP